MSTLTKAALSACLNRLKHKPVKEVLEDEEFQFFHQNRNFFNDTKTRVLTQIPPYGNLKNPVYRDEYGRKWTEERIGVIYHTSRITDVLRLGKYVQEREARKFLLPYELPGYKGCSSEMIIKRNGQRDGTTQYMETFNFGPAGARSTFSGISLGGKVLVDPGLHYKFDVAPHEEFDGYKSYQPYLKPPAPVRIIDVYDLIKQGRVQESEI